MSAQFVLLRHKCPVDFPKPSHWDFMLEHEGVLLCWQLNQLPAAWTKLLGLESTTEGNSVPVIQLANHHLAYLDYEGPVSGNRGSVVRVDRGLFHYVQRTEHSLLLHVLGTLLTGKVSLIRHSEGWMLSLESTGD